jgi:hypothetical protein
MKPFLYKLAGTVTVAAIPTLITLSVRYLNRRWNLELSDKELQYVSSMADKAVSATEQIFKNEPKGAATNDKKLTHATDYLIKCSRRASISLDREAAKKAIETAVGEVNMAKSAG